MFRHLLNTCAAFALFVTPAFSQDNVSGSPDPKISSDVLTLSLDPLTEEELKTEAGEWMKALKAVATRIADREIQLIKGEGDPAAINTDLEKLRVSKIAFISHTELVLDAYEIKGGDASKQRKYISAVRGAKADTIDVSTRVHVFQTWLKSKQGGVSLLFKTLKFTGILVVFWLLAASTSKFIRRAVEKQEQFSALLRVFINKMTRRVILGIGLVIALGTVGVNVGAAVALIGGGAFILAFALQDTLSNFAAGVMLLIYRPFDVGDAVEIGGIKGKVDSVSMVSTTILTFDNQKVLVPNKKVWGETITNITGMTTRRVDMLFGIGYGDDIAKAQEIIERVVAKHPLILQDPAANIGLHELADSAVNFRCWAWSATSDYLTVRTEVTRRVKEEFDAAGISIPFPQRDVHLHTVTPKI
jgi:small conductance mechanosensitive channel